MSKEGEEQSSDTDSGCYLISLEDEDLQQEDNTSLSVIPRDNLVPGSVLGQSYIVLRRSSGKVLELQGRGSLVEPDTLLSFWTAEYRTLSSSG